MDAHKKVAVAREHLIIDQRFFGSLICSMKIIPADRVRGFPIRTMATDGTSIWYNPGFVDGLTLAETKGVLMHEVLHKANAHHLRRAGRDARIWNKACDYAINPIVIAAKQILPTGGLINPAFSDWSAEEVYEQLVLPPPPSNQSKPGKGAPSKGEGNVNDNSKSKSKDKGDDEEDADEDDGDADDADDDGDDADEEDDERSGDEDGGEDAVPDGAGDGKEDEDEGPQAGTGADHGLILEPVNDEGQPLSPAEVQQAADELRVDIIQAARLAQAAGEQLGAGLTRLIEDAENPRKDWREVLRRFVSQSVETPVDQTWARPNRRFIHQGVYLPGWRKEGTNELLIAIDTSGSTISTPALPRFYAEMKRILEDTRPEKVTVIWCDNRIQRAETYTDPSQIPQDCPGCGGTAFSPVWRKVREMNIKPSGCVFFTDLICSDWGDDPGFPVLWAQWGHKPRTPPFGEVLDINQP